MQFCQTPRPSDRLFNEPGGPILGALSFHQELNHARLLMWEQLKGEAAASFVLIPGPFPQPGPFVCPHAETEGGNRHLLTRRTGAWPHLQPGPAQAGPPSPTSATRAWDQLPPGPPGPPLPPPAPLEGLPLPLLSCPDCFLLGPLRALHILFFFSFSRISENRSMSSWTGRSPQRRTRSHP